MRRLALLAVLAVLTLAVRTAAPGRSEEAPPRPADPVFRAVDLFVEAGDDALAAYQVELRFDPERVQVVGLEAGAPAVFGDAPHPYHDPAGFIAGRLVVAAFVDDDAKAPRGRVRVARLHLAVEGGAEMPLLSARLVTAAVPGGERISPAVEIQPTEGR